MNLRDRIVAAIWAELLRQRKDETRFPAVYADPEMGDIDGEVDMAAVAAAVIDILIDMAGHGELLQSIRHHEPQPIKEKT